MVTLHKLTWNKKDLAIYVNFESKSKQLIETYRYEDMMNSPIDWYRKELDVKFKTYDLSNTKRLKELLNFWAYMPIYVDKERRGKRTKFFNYITAKLLFGYDTDTYTLEDLITELSIKLWLAQYYRKPYTDGYLFYKNIFTSVGSEDTGSDQKYYAMLKLRYSPKTNILRLDLTEHPKVIKSGCISIPYDIYIPAGITSHDLSENLTLAFKRIFELRSN